MSKPKICSAGNHVYAATGEKYRSNNGADVEVWASFFCQRCCDVQDRVVAVWKGAAKNKNPTPSPDNAQERPF